MWFLFYFFCGVQIPIWHQSFRWHYGLNYKKKKRKRKKKRFLFRVSSDDSWISSWNFDWSSFQTKINVQLGLVDFFKWLWLTVQFCKECTFSVSAWSILNRADWSKLIGKNTFSRSMHVQTKLILQFMCWFGYRLSVYYNNTTHIVG